MLRNPGEEMLRNPVEENLRNPGEEMLRNSVGENLRNSGEEMLRKSENIQKLHKARDKFSRRQHLRN